MEEISLNCQLDNINLYQCSPGFCTDKRVFDYHYILYVHRGRGSYKVGSRKYAASAGDIFYCPPFIENTIMADLMSPYLLSGIEFRINGNSGMNLPINAHSNIIRNDFLVKCINEMIREYSYGKMYSREICNSILSVLIRSLIRLSKTQSPDNSDIAGEMLDYVVSNFNRNLSHRELSEKFAYHKNTINKILKNATGLSLKNYLIDLRIKKASELLVYSNKPLNEIAEICGYSNPVFFSRQFKLKVGVTPMQYRKSRQ